MSKMNLLIDLKGYDGSNANTCKTKFSKNVQYIGINISEEEIREVKIPALSQIVLFNDGDTRKFLYLETTSELAIEVNGQAEPNLKPIVINDSIKNGVYFKSSDINIVTLANDNLEELTVFYIASK